LKKYDVHLDFIAEHLGQEAIKDKAHQIYVGLSDEGKRARLFNIKMEQGIRRGC